ncbi:hypothetical protein JCM10207_006595 [Rhodosporidiobolus poonsookiae]
MSVCRTETGQATVVTSYSTTSTVVSQVGETATAVRTIPTVVPVLITQPGAVNTVCVPTSSSAAEPSSTSTPAARPSSTTTVVTTTVTSMPTSQETAFIRSTTTIPSEESRSSSSSTTDLPLVTSYRTVIVTSIDSAGRTSTWAEAVPTTLNAADASSKSTLNAGAIAGGVVGGIAALALLAALFWFGRKKGLFRRNADEIDEDTWAPRPHGEFYGGASGARAVGTGSGEDKLDALSEKDQVVDAATLERHRSWYNSLHGHGADPELDGAYDGMAPQRVPSPGPNGIGYGYEGGEATSSEGAAAGVALPRRTLSNRVSAYSGSSHSHDGHGSYGYSPQSYTANLPPVPDHRLSYGYFQNFGGPHEGYQEQLGHGAPYGPHSPPNFPRPRSASPPPLSSSPSVSRQPSIPGLAIPAHLRAESHGSRPSLGALQGGHARESSSSSSGALRGQTSDSFSSASSPHSITSPLHSRPGTSGSGLTPPSTAPPSGPSTPAAEKAPPLPALPSIERLKAAEGSPSLLYPKRPDMSRAASSDSFLVPSQFLGARVVNADDQRSVHDTDAERETFGGPDDSVDSLGLVKGEVLEQEVVVDVVR